MNDPITDDPLYDRAVAIVTEHGRVSISLVQRHLAIGYNHAAHLIEEMERRGVVSPQSVSGLRTLNPKSGHLGE